MRWLNGQVCTKGQLRLRKMIRISSLPNSRSLKFPMSQAGGGVAAGLAWPLAGHWQLPGWQPPTPFPQFPLPPHPLGATNKLDVANPANVAAPTMATAPCGGGPVWAPPPGTPLLVEAIHSLLPHNLSPKLAGQLESC